MPSSAPVVLPPHQVEAAVQHGARVGDPVPLQTWVLQPGDVCNAQPIDGFCVQEVTIMDWLQASSI